jgi:hypothetical protein
MTVDECLDRAEEILVNMEKNADMYRVEARAAWTATAEAWIHLGEARKIVELRGA